MSFPIILWLASAVLITGLIALAVIDARTYRLPNLLTFPLIATGLLFHVYFSGSGLPYLIGAILGYLLFLVIEISYLRLRGKNGLGRGDAKLLAAGGAWCGWFSLPFIMFLASGAALSWVIATGNYKNKNLRLPFGPFLALGIGAVWIAQMIYSG